MWKEICFLKEINYIAFPVVPSGSCLIYSTTVTQDWLFIKQQAPSHDQKSAVGK